MNGIEQLQNARPLLLVPVSKQNSKRGAVCTSFGQERVLQTKIAWTHVSLNENETRCDPYETLVCKLILQINQ